MEEVMQASYSIEGNSYKRTIKMVRVPKNKTPKPHYRGIEVCNKTPIRIRGEEVEVSRTTSDMRTLKNNVWTIRSTQTNKIISYANEIYLRNAEIKRKDNKVVIAGTIIPPVEERDRLRNPIGISKENPNRFFIATACEACKLDQEITGEIPLVKLVKEGVMV